MSGCHLLPTHKLLQSSKRKTDRCLWTFCLSGILHLYKLKNEWRQWSMDTLVHSGWKYSQLWSFWKIVWRYLDNLNISISRKLLILLTCLCTKEYRSGPFRDTPECVSFYVTCAGRSWRQCLSGCACISIASQKNTWSP